MSSRKNAGPGQPAATPPEGITLFRAPWLVTVNTGTDLLSRHVDIQDSQFLIENGGICVAGGRIIAVGRFADLRHDYGTAEVVDYEASILTPSLVNAHVHLELSHLAGVGDTVDYKGDLPAWIMELIADRERCRASASEIVRAGQHALDNLLASGTGLLADIGNQPVSSAIGNGARARVCFFLELLGMSKKASEAALALLNREEGSETICTIHAPYSCHADLIRAVKKQSILQQRIFTLHVAESAAEIEFLRYGTGGFRELLTTRGAWDDSFVPLAERNRGAVDYLDRLGVLDSNTLCVHAVHISKQEIALLAEKLAKVCLCPGSNRYLGVGKAPVADMLANGILPGLGTDSLASNRELNIWQEMKNLRTDHPGIEPSMIFAMATRGGAASLGYGDRLGMLSPGMEASVLAVACPVIERSEVFEYLTTIGNTAQPVWVCANEAEIRLL